MLNKLNFPIYSDLLMILLLWCAAVALANPIGDFPLNDDWAYGQNARALAVENRLYFSDWPAMTLMAHTLWGALFCKIFGFSFTVLRFSTLLMGLLGLVGFYQLLKWAGLSRHMMFGLTLLLAFNPFWFLLANSYMTDVPFLATLFWSTLFFLKTIEKPAFGTLLAATFFALWACFIRQLGLFVPGVFLLLLLYYQPINWRNALYAVLPAAVCFASMQAFTGWLRQTGQLSEAYRGIEDLWRSVMDNQELFTAVVQRSGIVLMTLGLFLLPLLISTFRKEINFRKPAVWLLLLPAAYCVWRGWLYFPVGNIFYNFGLGPKLVKDAFWGVNADPILPNGWFLCLKMAAAIGAGLLMLSLLPKGTTTERQGVMRKFSLGFCLLYWVFVCLNPLLLDRYLFVLLPFILLLLGISTERFSKYGIALWVVMALFSIVATHDYLAWNRARWQAGNQLLEQGVTPKQIDGGFEFNGWHQSGPVSQKDRTLKSWWFVSDDEWIVSFGSLGGYDPVAVVPYRRWLPPSLDTITINRRKAYTVTDSLWCGMERLTADNTAYLPEAGNLQAGNGNTRSADRVRSGQFSMKLTPSSPFGATTSLDTFWSHDRLIISVWRYPANAAAGIVLAADDAEKAYFLETAHIIKRDSAGWELLQMAVTLPEAAIGSKGRFYIWNLSSEQTVWFDDLKVYRMQAR
jgi:hypothetical protein